MKRKHDTTNGLFSLTETEFINRNSKAAFWGSLQEQLTNSAFQVKNQTPNITAELLNAVGREKRRMLSRGLQ